MAVCENVVHGQIFDECVAPRREINQAPARLFPINAPHHYVYGKARVWVTRAWAVLVDVEGVMALSFVLVGDTS